MLATKLAIHCTKTSYGTVSQLVWYIVAIKKLKAKVKLWNICAGLATCWGHTASTCPGCSKSSTFKWT